VKDDDSLVYVLYKLSVSC